MDIVLFNPAPRSGWEPSRRVELPLSLLCPATPLIHAGYRVRIIDQFADRHWKEKLLDALAEKPICFGVSSTTGPQILRALRVCKLFKKGFSWVVPKTTQMIEGLGFPLMFLERGKFVNPYSKTKSIVTGLAKMYRPFSWYRIKHMYARFPIETKIVKNLCLFGRQN